MTYFIDRLGVIRWWLFALLAALAPFHAFLITWLKNSLSGPEFFLVSAWREIVVAGIICLAVFENFLIRAAQSVRLSLSKPDLLGKFIFAFVMLALIFGLFQIGTSRNFFQWVWGFRYDVLPLLLLAAARQVKWGNVDRLIKIALFSGGIVVLFGFLHSFILPKDFLTNFGYSLFPGPYRPDIPISACQYLEHTSSFCRATATFGGPTRYGIYLLFLLGLAAFRFPKIIPFIVIGIFTTFSRSVIIGLAAMIIYFVVSLRARRVKQSDAKRHLEHIRFAQCKLREGSGLLRFARNDRWLSAFAMTTIVLAFVASIIFFRSPAFESFIVRQSSTNEHFVYMKQGVETILSHPLGLGLGTAGPASLHFEKFLTENWYLQIGVEMGVLGLLFYLGIIIVLLKKLLSGATRSLAFGLGLALLGISVAGLFTHSFEETTAVLLLFGFIGMALPRTLKSHPQSF